MNPAERLDALEMALGELRERAAGGAVLVEGRRDADALERLGVGGTHLLLNTGSSVQVRIDEVAQLLAETDWPRLIVLMDWDRTGGRLQDTLVRGLAGRAPVDTDARRRIAVVSRVKSVEDLPADLASLRRQVEGRT